MVDYDFRSLNDKEFEVLVTDLISAELLVHVERFKPGRDQGVDGRFFATPEKEVIVQSKHYLKSGYKKLLSKLINDELPKVKKLQPARYIVATSLVLSRKNKQEIMGALKPFIKLESDILGAEDINDFLKRHKRVEENHYKLWISSTGVLQTILHSAIKGRSRDFIDSVVEESCRYVITDNHTLALDKVNKENVVILTGVAGVGKTTLANGLCLHFAAKGFEVVCIEGDMSEAEAVYDPEKMQIFYFDDFLGSNYLTALNNREDSHIVRFIKRVQKDNKKKFVLTSRTNIINRGKKLSDKFKIENIEKNELEVELKNISLRDKAHILYNHIYYSDLNDEYIEKLYFDKRYMDIINHANFNPRLIQFITDGYKVSSIDPSKYWDYVIVTLSDPTHIWDNVFDVQIDEHCRDLVSLVVANGAPLQELELSGAFNILESQKLYGTGAVVSVDFITTTKTVTGALLNREVDTGFKQIKYELFNPSIGDFVLSRLSGNVDYLFLLFNSLKTVSSLKNLSDFFTNSIISEEAFCKVLNSLSEKIVHYNFDYRNLNYNFFLIKMLIDNKDLLGCGHIETILKDTFGELDFDECREANFLIVLDVLIYSISLGLDKSYHNRVDKFIASSLDDGLDHDYLILVNNLLRILSSDNVMVTKDKLKKEVILYWEEFAETFLIEEAIIEDICEHDEVDRAVIKVHETLDEILGGYDFEISDQEFEKIISHIDVEHIVYKNFERYASDMMRDDEGWGKSGGGDNLDMSDDSYIQDLFARD